MLGNSQSRAKSEHSLHDNAENMKGLFTTHIKETLEVIEGILIFDLEILIAFTIILH